VVVLGWVTSSKQQERVVELKVKWEKEKGVEQASSPANRSLRSFPLVQRCW
jgi:hypothetical protein